MAKETIQEVLNSFMTAAASLFADYAQRIEGAQPTAVWGGEEEAPAKPETRAKMKTEIVEDAAEAPEVYSEEDLKEMKLGEIRKLFGELSGGKDAPSGGKTAIVNAILELQKGKKRKPSDEESKVEYEDLSDSEDEEGEDSEVKKDVDEALKGFSEDEIKKVCAALKLSTNGKREALVHRIISEIEDDDSTVTMKKLQKASDAVFEDRGDDDEPPAKEKATSKKGKKAEEPEEPEEDDEEDDDKGNDENGGGEDKEEDLPDYTDRDVATEERVLAMDALEKRIALRVKNGKLTEKEMKTFCTDFYGKGNFDLKDIPGAYTEAKLRMIDDEGKEHETEESYVLNEYVACCGFYTDDEDPDDQDNETTVCSRCGAKYESEN